MRITVGMLREKRARCPQVKVFKDEWRNGCEATLENLLRAVELDLDIEWFAGKFLPTPIWERYCVEVIPIWRRYMAGTSPIAKRYVVEIAHIIAILVKEMEEKGESLQ